jgi:hypothetical protein
MNPQSYEQVDVPSAIIGEQAKFLDPGMQIPVEFVEGRAVSVVFPDFVEVKIAETAPPSHGQVDSAWKAARLSNDVEIMGAAFRKKWRHDPPKSQRDEVHGQGTCSVDPPFRPLRNRLGGLGCL